ncbi:MAG: archaea-specific SMC-related protein [Euryarchaeota archaeon]|nr:archaea-specific SMC-related protein [Euryarchaeota archaeon]
MKLELQNIGGFTGVHEFELKKGINRITAPNAKGKSSLLRGIQCLASDNEIVFSDTLNDDSDTGHVKLGDEYIRHLRRANDAVQADPADHTFFDELDHDWRNAEKIAFFTPKSRVVLEIDQNAFDVLRFVNSISGAEEIESDIRRKEAQLEEKKRELEEYIENLTTAQKLDAEVGTMRGEIQKLQGEVQELEGAIEKETGTRDLTKVGEDIAAKKQEILDLEERLRSREGEVKRYQDQYEKARALYERLDEDIADFEQRSETESVEEFTKRLSKHERKRKDLKNKKDELDDLYGVVDKAYKVFSDSERAPAPESIKDEPLLNKASVLLGNPGECPVCRGGAVRNTLDDRRKELKECATDFAKAIRGEEEEMKVIKADIRELHDRIEGINAKRRERDKAKRDSNDLLKELDDRKNLRDGVDEEIAEKEHEREILEQQYDAAAKTVRIESRDQLNKVREKIGGYENEIRNNQNDMDRLTREIPDYTSGESLEDYATKKRLGLDDLRLKIEELKDGWEHEVFGAVDLFNKNINDIYKEMGFTTFRDIKITKEILRGRLTSLDAVVEHASGKKQSLSSLSKAEQLTLGLVFQISAKENYISNFPFFVIDDNMNTFDPDRSRSIMEYLSDKAEYVLVSRPVPPSEQGDLSIEYGFN